VLLLACDGLWDVMSNEEAVQKLQELYSQQPTSMKAISEAMVTAALDLGSKDNISAIVARLPGYIPMFLHQNVILWVLTYFLLEL